MKSVGLPVVELLDVVTGAERVAGAAKDHDATAPVDGDVLDRGVELGRHLTIERVVHSGRFNVIVVTGPSRLTISLPDGDGCSDMGTPRFAVGTIG